MGDRDCGVRAVRRRGEAWTAEEIHDAVKACEPAYVVLPNGFPPAVAARLFVTDHDILLWLRFPTVLDGAPTPDAFVVADRPCATRTAREWRRVADALGRSGNRGDAEVAVAILGDLASLAGQNPEAAVMLALAEPADWRERVARAEARLDAIAK